ncbi:amino acid ABC transporter permease [Jatrophihabitans telluris]|uniref:Amino acid ABC transporter permease n=1 Tax=Jatrophihabitans telluris TaxID=2038343 RepID=A0ABY4R048_9ACTN|nr:amino acid ABC transporter permease [Jatrophihabitans telluris]UQX88877.1 amino acid ABC transporter permease [Jatrophihabitans telluris]
MTEPKESLHDGGSRLWTPSARQQQRIAYRRARAVRSGLIAAASTLLVFGAIVVALLSSPGWPRTRQTFFNWHYATEAFPHVLQGLWLNIRVMVICAVLVLIIGLGLAVLRTLRGPIFLPLRIFAAAYTDLFRGLPLLLVLFLVGFGIPALRLAGISYQQTVVYGGVALTLTYSAYVAEVFRAGIESVHPSQRAAARSLGLSAAQTMRFVVLPQAIRRVIPPLLNDFVSLQKDSGLIAVLGDPIDAIRAAQIETANTFNYTSYVVAGFLFLMLTIPLTRFTDWIAKRQGWYGTGGSPTI